MTAVDAAAAEVVQVEALFEAPVIGFDAPAAVVQFGERRGRKVVLIKQRGGQDFNLAGGQRHPDQAQRDPGGRIQARVLTGSAGPSVAGAAGDDLLAPAGGGKGLDVGVVAARQAHQVVLAALSQGGEEPVGGIAPVEQDQAVGRGVVEMKRGTAALIHGMGERQPVQGLTGEHIVEG